MRHPTWLLALKIQSATYQLVSDFFVIEGAIFRTKQIYDLHSHVRRVLCGFVGDGEWKFSTMTIELRYAAFLFAQRVLEGPLLGLHCEQSLL